MANLLERLLADIKECYGSFSEPSWGFLYDRKGMYLGVINDLNQRSFFSIEDISDYMEFGYGPMLELIHDNQRWTLWLTFVGRYAYFLKYMEGRNFKAVSCNEDCTISEEIEILAILKNHNITLLTREIVNLPIPEFKIREYLSEPIEIPTICDILFFDS
jgi:hypothetical protein